MEIIDMTHSIPESNYNPHYIRTPRGICLHLTSDIRKGQALEWFQNPNAKVSAHYIIERDGTKILCVYPNMKAYHAGDMNNPTSDLVLNMGRENPNNYLIGIEVVSDGRDINDVQFKELKELVIDLCATYAIPINRYHIIGHYEINRRSKPYCPVWAYHPLMVIKGIENDKKVDTLNRKLAIADLALTDTEGKYLEVQKDIKYQEGIIKKVRRQYKEMRGYYQDAIKKWLESKNKR